MANRFDIPEGRDHAIPREELAQRWHCTVRETRTIIARLRLERAEDAILSTSHTPPGYWRSTSPGEIATFINEMERRARNTFLVLRGARHVLEARNGGDEP